MKFLRQIVPVLHGYTIIVEGSTVNCWWEGTICTI